MVDGSVLAAVVALLALLPACAHRASTDWARARHDAIDPMNTALHRQLPSSVTKQDLDAIMAFYAAADGGGIAWSGEQRIAVDSEEETWRWDAPGGPEPIRLRWESLLARFATIEKTELRIDRVDWRNRGDDGWPA